MFNINQLNIGLDAASLFNKGNYHVQAQLEVPMLQVMILTVIKGQLEEGTLCSIHSNYFTQTNIIINLVQNVSKFAYSINLGQGYKAWSSVFLKVNRAWHNLDLFRIKTQAYLIILYIFLYQIKSIVSFFQIYL